MSVVPREKKPLVQKCMEPFDNKPNSKIGGSKDSEGAARRGGEIPRHCHHRRFLGDLLSLLIRIGGSETTTCPAMSGVHTVVAGGVTFGLKNWVLVVLVRNFTFQNLGAELFESKFCDGYFCRPNST